VLHAFDIDLLSKVKNDHNLFSNNRAHPRAYLDRCLRARDNAHKRTTNHDANRRAIDRNISCEER